MRTLTSFFAERPTNLTYSPETLQQLPCGLFRAPLDQAYSLMPEFAELYDSAPVDDPRQWELDLKIHMLMKNQYPALPNWHCDNVPRDQWGRLDYSAIDPSNPRMLLWISGGPHTEFLSFAGKYDNFANHGEMADRIRERNPETTLLPANTWVSMDQMTPHRAIAAKEHTWRVFARLTHRSIAPQRPVLSMIRRHCQVYLDPTTFSW